uniref:Uncharacterized protein n=1 Tax=Tanacetum cinerariifolium TaxID=118510 RepID=A0A699IUK9_TANCI|nr:hypothetical protein [Tanacetum cinerariifolium]
MLDKDLYDSWKSRMELYMQNREHERMILESVEHGPLIWPTIKENGVTITKKYVELSATEKIQADYGMKETNIVLQGDDLIACLNKATTFLIVVASSRRDKGKVVLVLVIEPERPKNAVWYKDKTMLGEAQEAGQILDEKQIVFLADLGVPDGQNAKAVLMANISNYGSNIISVANKEQNNESVTVELERYKELVGTFEQRLNIDLSSREKMIDSQMDDMIKEKLALKEQVDSLEQNLSKQIKEKGIFIANIHGFQI